MENIRPMTPLVVSNHLHAGALAPRSMPFDAGTRARARPPAPAVLTGCLSELSSCEQPDHGYLDAVKNYAECYAAAQAYLAPGDPLLGHDYTLQVPETEELGQLGLIGDGEFTPVFSDEEVADCGYLGWLRH